MCKLKNDEAKIEYLNEHFHYECEMLLYSIIKWNEYNKRGNTLDIFMAMECFLMHARNLFEFLYYGKNEKYPRAIYFYETNEKWEILRPNKTESLISFENRISEEVVHLTYGRKDGTSQEKTWYLGNIFKDLRNTIKIFINNLQNKYLTDDLKSLLDEIEKIIIK